MAEEPPVDRCGFEPRPKGWFHAQSWELETSAVCCWRPVWESHEGTDRCIWHADVSEKQLTELRNARIDGTERLDGAVLRNLDSGTKKVLLDGCKLLGAKFDGSNLPEISFIGADLRGATFVDTYLREANFTDAELNGADFTDAILPQTDFTDANLRSATFSEGFLRQADFTDADLKWGDLTNAYLQEADFTNTNSRAIFTNTDLKKANFTGTSSTRASFTSADLREVEFTNADLTKANFTDADLREADFTDADLKEADLSDSDAKKANFHHATLQDAVFARTDCRETVFTSALIYEAVFSDTRINSKTRFVDQSTTFYDSITSRPSCIYEENSLTTATLPEDVQSREAARWVYRRLETLHEGNALSESAREFHISKEEAERALYWERGEYGPWAVKTLMWYLTRHGESVKRVLTWWGGVILTAGLLFPFVGGVTDTDGTEYAITSLRELGTITGWQEILMNIYFSVTTFSTIMDGGLAPAGMGTRAVVAVESITGALLVALLVFVLGRRTAR